MDTAHRVWLIPDDVPDLLRREIPCTLHLLLTDLPGRLVQEKQIRARAGMRQLRERMRDRRLQVTDRVSKHMLANVRLLPKVRPAPPACFKDDLCRRCCCKQQAPNRPAEAAM